MKTRVVNLKKEPYDVYIGRGSPFGNPFVVGLHISREVAITKFKQYFYDKLETDWQFRNNVIMLTGKILGCFCKPLACHGDVIVEYLERIIK